MSGNQKVAAMGRNYDELHSGAGIVESYLRRAKGNGKAAVTPDRVAKIEIGNALREYLSRPDIRRIKKRSHHILRRVFSYLDPQKHVFFLCDGEGVIIDIVAAPEDIYLWNSKEIRVGTGLSLESIGLNAVGIALDARRIIAVKGEQCEYWPFREWNWVAKPFTAYFRNTPKSGGPQHVPACIGIGYKSGIDAGYYSAILDCICMALKGDREAGNTPKLIRRIDDNEAISLISEYAMLEYSLSMREIDVFREMLNGRSYLHISKVLSISESTVKYHAANICLKIGCRSISDAIRRACLGYICNAQHD